jgi:hypothetical protein
MTAWSGSSRTPQQLSPLRRRPSCGEQVPSAPVLVSTTHKAHAMVRRRQAGEMRLHGRLQVENKGSPAHHLVSVYTGCWVRMNSHLII